MIRALESVISTSITFKILNNLWERLCFFEFKINEFYHNSQTCFFVENLYKKSKMILKYSFLGRITEKEQKFNSTFFNSSKFGKCAMNLLRITKNKISTCFNTSSIYGLIKELDNNLISKPIKCISMFVLVTIILNILFVVFLKNKINLLLWFIQLLLLFLAYNGLNTNVDLEVMKKKSFFLKLVNKTCII